MNNSLESMERLLRSAAAFEPERQCPEDIVERALNRVKNRRIPVATWSVALAAACFLAWIALRPATNARPAPQSGPEQLALKSDGGNRSTELGNHKKTQPHGIHREPRAARRTKERKVVRRQPPAVEHLRHSQRRRMIASLPKAIWQDEEVHSYHTGVMAAALVVSSDEDHRVHVQPGVIQIPLAEGQLIATNGITKEERE